MRGMLNNLGEESSEEWGKPAQDPPPHTHPHQQRRPSVGLGGGRHGNKAGVPSLPGQAQESGMCSQLLECIGQGIMLPVPLKRPLWKLTHVGHQHPA